MRLPFSRQNSPVECALNIKQININKQNISLDTNFSQLFNGEACQSLSVEQKSYSVYFCFPLFKINAKEKFHQIDLRIVKLPNRTGNNILSNFDLHGRSSKSDIFRVTTVAK